MRGFDISMKYISHIILSLLLVTSTTGLTISKHYCGNILRDVAIFDKFDKCCGEDEMPMGCCHDEKEQYSVDDDYHVIQLSVDQHLVVLSTAILTNFIEFTSEERPVSTSAKPPDPPPTLLDNRLYRDIECFLI